MGDRRRLVALLPIAAAIGAAVGAFAALTGRRAGERIEREYARRHPPGPGGIAGGAEPFTEPGTSGLSVLLLHGSGDTPQTLRYLGERLASAGHAVHAPLLPGHGRSPRAFTTVSAAAYLAHAREALAETRAMGERTAIVGLSMGGAIAAQLAAEEGSLGALVLLAPYLEPPRSVRAAALASWGWGMMMPYVNGRGAASVHDAVAGAESRAYGVFPPRALRALVETAALGRRALPRVTSPVLVINSEQDNRIPAALARRAVAGIGAPLVHEWVRGCGHIITVDYCRSAVADRVVAFLAQHAAGPAA